MKVRRCIYYLIFMHFCFSTDTANETLTDYQLSFQKLQIAVDYGNLTADIHEDFYVIDLNQTDVDGKVICGEGETQVKFYCGKLLATKQKTYRRATFFYMCNPFTNERIFL